MAQCGPRMFMASLTLVVCGAWDLPSSIPEVHVPQLQAPKHLVVACLWSAPQQITRNPNVTQDRAELAMLGSLAGLLLRHGSPQGVGLYIEANVDSRMVLQDLVHRRNLSYMYANGSAWDIALRLSRAAGVDSFALYDGVAKPQSTNVARMATTVYNALMVDRSVQQKALEVGFKLAVDVSELDDEWSLTHWIPSWNGSKAIAVEQSNSFASDNTDRVNDIAPAFGAIAFGDVGTGNKAGPYRDSFLKAMPQHGLVFGWPSYAEVVSIPDVSAHDKLYVVCEMSFNLALLSTYRNSTPLLQKGTGAPVPPATHAPWNGKHYVTFHFTDGDNVEWLDGEHPGHEFFSSGQFWDAKGRGEVPLAWGMPTIQNDLGRSVMEMMYETATPKKDVFIAVSPIGYGYVSKLSPALRQANALEQGKRMASLDMHILNLIDFRPQDYDQPNHPLFPAQESFADVYRPYMQQNAIEAMFLYPWDTGYEGNGTVFGSIDFVEGKPIITGRTSLWQTDGCIPTGRYGSSGCRNATNVANVLNDHAAKQNGTNASLSSGFSVVPVNVWTAVGTVAAVLDTVKQLDTSKIEVVPADVLVKLIQQHMKGGSSLPSPIFV